MTLTSSPGVSPFAVLQTVPRLLWTQIRASLYSGRIEVPFTPQQQGRLSKIATQEGIDPEELVKDAALSRLSEASSRRRNGRPRQTHVPLRVRVRWTLAVEADLEPVC